MCPNKIGCENVLRILMIFRVQILLEHSIVPRMSVLFSVIFYWGTIKRRDFRRFFVSQFNLSTIKRRNSNRIFTIYVIGGHNKMLRFSVFFLRQILLQHNKALKFSTLFRFPNSQQLKSRHFICAPRNYFSTLFSAAKLANCAEKTLILQQ